MNDRYTRRFWIGVLAQLTLLALLAVGVTKSEISGRHLLMAASLWLVAVLAWNQLGPSSFFLSLGKRIGRRSRWPLPSVGSTSF